MKSRHALACVALALAVWAGNGGARIIGDEALPSNYVPSGQTMFRQYCATCHGSDAMGHGPLSAFLKVPPSDLTVLARQHGGSFHMTTSPVSFNLGQVHPSTARPTCPHGVPSLGTLIRTMNARWEDESRIYAII